MEQGQKIRRERRRTQNSLVNNSSNYELEKKKRTVMYFRKERFFLNKYTKKVRYERNRSKSEKCGRVDFFLLILS